MELLEAAKSAPMGKETTAESDTFTAALNSIRTDCAFKAHLARFVVNSGFYSNGLSKKLQNLVINGFLGNLSNRIDNFSRPVLSLEKKVCERYLGEKFPDFPSFTRFLQLNPSYINELLGRYPELARVLDVLVDGFIRHYRDFTTALVNDIDVIVDQFFLKSTGLADISSIELTEGELHSGARSIIIVHAGGTPQFVYKPRCVATEARLTALLTQAWARTGIENEWNLPRYLPKTDYGWVEWVQNIESPVEANHSEFFLKAGFLVGFCEAFGITDMHHNNVVCDGYSPIPIDIEAAFNPDLITSTSAERESSTLSYWNALGTGLLPASTWKGQDLVGIDTCGLGGLVSQYCSMPVTQLQSKNAQDEVPIESGVTVHPAKNLLVVAGRAVPPWEHTNRITEGYEAALSDLSKLPETRRMLEDFCELPTRVILQSTAGYHFIIQASCHPSLMRDTADRRSYIATCLERDVAGADEILKAEIDSCLNGDVPRFITTPSADFCWDPEYTRCREAGKALKNTGRYCFMRTINSLDSERLEFGKRTIQGSLAAMQIHYGIGLGASTLLVSENNSLDPATTPSASISTAAQRSVDMLENYIEKNCNREWFSAWFGCKGSPSGGIEFGRIGLDFYHGITGVFWGVLALGKNVPSQAIERLAHELRGDFSSSSSKIGGGYIGLASALLPLLSIFRISSASDIDAKSLLEAAKTRFESALDGKYPLQWFTGSDLFCGVAGSLAVTSLLYSDTKDSAWKSIANSLFELLQRQSKTRGSLQVFPAGNAISRHSSGCLTGLSHGQIGIALALHYYCKSLGDGALEPARQLKEDLVRWEIGTFDFQRLNWPDYRIRSSNSSESFEFGWSHGAPGIYLALTELAKDSLAARNFLSGVSFADIARRALTMQCRPRNVTLCHGGLGVEGIATALLQQEGKQDSDLLQGIVEWAQLARFAEFDATTEGLSDFDLPGLFAGRAGAALGYSRLIGKAIDLPLMLHQLTTQYSQ